MNYRAKDGKRVYGAWVGNPQGHLEEEARCIKEVWPTGRMIIDHQCYRNRGHGPDGLYCKQHAKYAREDD